MERESKPAHGLHCEMLQEGQGLDSLFSGSSHMFELGEEGKVLLPISAAPVGPVSQQGNSPFMQQQKQSALHLLMRDQQGSQEPAKSRGPCVLRISTMCWVDLLFHSCFSQFRGLI